MQQRSVSFAVRRDQLVRQVIPARGAAYEHTCTRIVFEEVADSIEDFWQQPFSRPDLRWQAGKAPWTQGDVALAFLVDCGLIVRSGRRYKRSNDYNGDHARRAWDALEKGAE